MITIQTPLTGREWNPPLDTFVIQMERMLKRNPDLTDQEIATIKYNEGLECIPLSVITQIREALKADDHPACGFSEGGKWLDWASKHSISDVVEV